MAKLIIVAEFDASKLGWEGEPLTDKTLVDVYNEYYAHTPWEAFEIALQDDNFYVTEARIVE